MSHDNLPQKFTKKPVTIEAILWDGTNIRPVMDFMEWRNASHDEREGLKIRTLEGTLSANVGDWIIKGVKGEFYACKPDIFAMTYDAGQRDAVAASGAGAPAGWQLVPIEPTHSIISAMATSKAHDDEGSFDALLDLIGFSGENKTHTVLKAAYAAALAAAPTPDRATKAEAAPRNAGVVPEAIAQRTEDIRLRLANPTGIPRSALLHYTECLLAHIATMRPAATEAPDLGARDAVLEKAALACEAIYKDSTTMRLVSAGFAEKVRALKSQPAAAVVAPVEAVTDWQRITAPGQVHVGDKLRFNIGDTYYSETAKLILHAGTDKEEIIYNKRQNFYVITSMCMKNAGSSKNVEFLAKSKGGA